MFASLPSPVEMSCWDRAAIELGVPEMLLMENASREALRVLLETVAHLEQADNTDYADATACIRGKRILLFMGSGNNGGDAACLARHVHDAGADVLVLHTRPLRACTGTTRKHVLLARRCGVTFALASRWPDNYRNTRWDRPDIVVDGLLGTGFTGTLRPLEHRLVEGINALSSVAVPGLGQSLDNTLSQSGGVFVFALDIPSGLNGLTGRPCPLAVRAHATVSFEAAKPGLMFPEAAPFVGKLHVRSIGIPRVVRDLHPASYRLIDREIAALLPLPAPHWHKGTAGNVLIVGGSMGSDGDLTGAAHLAALAALRSGAGLVSVAAPSGLCADIKAHCADIMTRPLGAPGTLHWSPALLADLLPFLQRCDAVVIGPGLGREPGTIAFVHAFLALERPPTVIDADALYALATASRFHLNPADILTPHPGEAARILEKLEEKGKRNIGEGEGNPSEEGLPFPLPEPLPYPSQDFYVEGVPTRQEIRLSGALGGKTEEDRGLSGAVRKQGEEERKDSAWVQADRFAALDALVALSPAVWILKGAGTLVGSADCPVSISPYAVPNLAVGGSGDVLSGCLGTLLAQMGRQGNECVLNSHLAACLGVLVHVQAGHLLARTFPQRGNTATDIAEALPEARAILARRSFFCLEHTHE